MMYQTIMQKNARDASVLTFLSLFRNFRFHSWHTWDEAVATNVTLSSPLPLKFEVAIRSNQIIVNKAPPLLF
jgi:hypothetical protein